MRRQATDNETSVNVFRCTDSIRITYEAVKQTRSADFQRTVRHLLGVLRKNVHLMSKCVCDSV